MQKRLVQIEEATQQRVASILLAHPEWPCRKGCDDCCRSLASEPRVSRVEWLRIAEAIGRLPDAEETRERVRANAGAVRPVTCALLDRESGACRIYEARPIACQTYGFYAERDKVLGCGRIEEIAESTSDVLWGNHASVERELTELGPAKPLSEWLDSSY